jgi:hypothetical protein
VSKTHQHQEQHADEQKSGLCDGWEFWRYTHQYPLHLTFLDTTQAAPRSPGLPFVCCRPDRWVRAATAVSTRTNGSAGACGRICRVEALKELKQQEPIRFDKSHCGALGDA